MTWHALTHFGFAQPAWLWLLALPPILAWRLGRAGGRARRHVFVHVDALEAFGKPRAARAGAFRGVLLAAALTAAVIALARPQLSNAFTQIQASGIDIMIGLDVSGSMLTEDYTINGERTNRVTAIKEITQRFIDARPNDRIGMLAFAGRPYLVSPPTLDHRWLIENLDRVKIGLVEDGTAIGDALASAANRLKNREAKSRIIVLLSDGENNAGRVNPETAAEAVRVLGLKIYTIGVGTDGIAPIPVIDPRTHEGIYAQIDKLEKSHGHGQQIPRIPRPVPLVRRGRAGVPERPPRVVADPLAATTMNRHRTLCRNRCLNFLE